jgi:lysine biosynthesis protein LysW
VLAIKKFDSWSTVMTRVFCPSCGNEFNLDAKRSKLGDFILCRECDSRLEIVWLDPIELDFAFDEEIYDGFDVR